MCPTLISPRQPIRAPSSCPPPAQSHATPSASRFATAAITTPSSISATPHRTLDVLFLLAVSAKIRLQCTPISPPFVLSTSITATLRSIFPADTPSAASSARLSQSPCETPSRYTTFIMIVIVRTAPAMCISDSPLSRLPPSSTELVLEPPFVAPEDGQGC
ncbi:hypothetical protein C2E23DRAFT_884256 [Lenzites betulinus]|nr:hypothetical protein C2E23DRAFT_884256 [Lenzites betulinus]